MKIISALLLACLFTTTSFSQTPDKAKLDSFFSALEKSNKWMGSVAVAKGGKIIYTNAIGYADREAQQKADANTKYRIGSISKTFTTVLVFKAIEAGKLSLTQTIDKYFPTVPNAGKITVAQLLNHRSGIHNFTNDKEYLTWNTRPHTQQEMIAIVAKGGSDFVPDSKAEYSNSNFLLLSYILQTIYKKPYATLLQEQIIQPLHLQNTLYGGKINLKKNEAASYGFESDKWIKSTETDMSIPVGAGAIVSTPVDLTQFATALFSGKLISAKSLEQMKTMKDNFGMGLFVMPFYNSQGYGHTGGIDKFSSVFTYFPKDSIAYALTSNGSNFDNNQISIAVLNWVNDLHISIPFTKSYTPTTAELESYTGIYASTTFPLKITVGLKGSKLMAQATGQSAFELTATEKDKFDFVPAGIEMEFNPAKKQLTLHQGGNLILFTKE